MINNTDPNPTIIIRQASVADAAELQTLRLEALQNRPEAFGGDYDREKQEAVSDWEKRLSEQTDHAIFVAVAKGNLVAMTSIGFPDRPKLKHNGTIWGVYVQPQWRGRGISNQLIDACADWAKSHSIKLLRLAVASTNLSAINSYARSGFRVYGIDPQVIYYDGVYYDELLMIRNV